jgi:4-amino-4-deoxy-L-arabinose transferase-like glycosyltransferase
VTVSQRDSPAVLKSDESRSTGTVLHFRLWLALLTAGALVLRLLIVYQTRGDLLGGGDGATYSLEANQNAAGKWFVNSSNTPDALHPPGWTFVLTVWAWLGGHSWLTQQVLAGGIGTATVAVIGLAGRRIAGDRAGLVAAGIAAVYAGLWIYERPLFSETLLLLGIAGFILIAYRFRDRPSGRRAIGLGVVCGLLALTRSEQVLVLPLLVVPLIWTAKGITGRRRIGWLALAGASMLVVLAPWTIFNLGRFERPVLLSNNLGSAMRQGSCDASFYGSIPPRSNNPNFRDFTGPGQVGWFDLRCLEAVQGDQSEADAAYRQAALTYTEHHLSRLPIVLVAREGRAFGYWDPLQQVTLDGQLASPGGFLASLSYAPAEIWVGRLGLFEYWLLLVPAVAGAVILRRRRVPIYPLLAFVATAVIAVAVTFGEIRYRAAAEIPIVLLAAIAIDALLPSMRFAGPSRDAHDLTRDKGYPSDTDSHDSTTTFVPPVRAPFVSVRALAVAGLTLCVAGVIGFTAATRPHPSTTRAGTKIIAPSNGAKLVGTQAVYALAPQHTTKVKFFVSGGTLHDALVATGKAYPLGWIARWNTSKVPDGTYTLQAVAYGSASKGQPSAVVSVKITHQPD